MPTEITLWILGGFAAVFISALMAGLRSHANLSERVTRLEAVMSLFGQKAAKILHSPHDPDGIDDLLDKYIDRCYELSFLEWQRLQSTCDRIENDRTRSKDERTLAAFLSTVCKHKLMIPPTLRKHHE